MLHFLCSASFQTSETQSKRQNKRPLLRPPEGGFEAVNRGFESRV